MCRRGCNPCKLLSAPWARSTSTREHRGGRGSLKPPPQGLRLLMQGNRRPCFSSAVQHAELCPAYPFALRRKGNISTTQHEQRKQQFPCPSLAVTALIQDVGIKHNSASTRWNSDPSVWFRKSWISSETGERNTLSHCVKQPVWKLLGWSPAGRAACLWLRWHSCAMALRHEEKSREKSHVSENGNSRTVPVQWFMYENQGSYSFQV